ncbi:MAG: type III pantothenate kinase [Halarsenatibacteraceae bacterium]
MILTLDIGNSNIFIGLYNDRQLVNNWRIATDKNKTSDEYGVILMNLFAAAGHRLTDVENIIISSVVPSVMRSLKEMTGNYFQANLLTVGPGIKTGINIRTDNPKEVGSDRIVNAVAAKVKYSPPLIIVDFGTATTICAVSAEGSYLGGAIAPGIEISTEALFNKADKLPKIEVAKPLKAIGKNTEDSLKSGIYYGFIGQVVGLIGRFKQELGENAMVIGTGGFVREIGYEIEEIDVIDEFLTLDGLYHIGKINGYTGDDND